ncbi:MAG: glycosyltransferase [Gemmatimonadetes bacterium]|nr:glycosyltransferase [Gemmatimonadota bacterium]
MIAAILLVLSIVGSTWAFILYPVRLRQRAGRRSRRVWPRDIEPAVTVIIPVFNRASIIAEKLRNTLSLDYPADRMEVLVVSDGSTDGTDAIVAGVQDPRVRLVKLPRGGKLHAIQQGTHRARGEVLVFTDPDALLDAGSLRALLRPLGDPLVGAACGARKLRRSHRDDATTAGELFFARLERRIRRLESRLGNVYAGDSALYAIRRALFVPATNPAQADDIAISARVILSGKRFVYAADAVCRKPATGDAVRDFRRRVQIANYGIRSLLDLLSLRVLSVAYGLQLFSHTIARHLIPVSLATGITTSAMLARAHVTFAAVLGAHLLFLSLAGTGWMLRRTRVGRLSILAIPCCYVAHSLAGFVGVLGVLRGLRPIGANPRRAHAGAPAAVRSVAVR